VIDANVAVKWIFPDPLVEPHADRALEVLDAVRRGRIDLIQPVHWLLETTAVVLRLNPNIVQRATGLLDALELRVCDEHFTP
jgi:predicted nucleic acid-binding protein